MSRDKSIRLDFFKFLIFVLQWVFRGSSSSNNIPLFIIVLQQFPEFALFDHLSDFLVFEVIADSWASSQVHESLIRQSSRNGFVASMHLSISFLDEHHPKFVAVRARKHCATVWETRQVVVDSHVLPFTVLAEPYNIDSSIIEVLGFKQSLNKSRSFSHS